MFLIGKKLFAKEVFAELIFTFQHLFRETKFCNSNSSEGSEEGRSLKLMNHNESRCCNFSLRSMNFLAFAFCAAFLVGYLVLTNKE